MDLAWLAGKPMHLSTGEFDDYRFPAIDNTGPPLVDNGVEVASVLKNRPAEDEGGVGYLGALDAEQASSAQRADGTANIEEFGKLSRYLEIFRCFCLGILIRCPYACDLRGCCVATFLSRFEGLVNDDLEIARYMGVWAGIREV